jgi:hypothetical protein
MRGSNGSADVQRFTNSGRGAIRDYIEDERVEMERQKVADEKERAHLSARFGIDLLGPDVDEEQLLAYARLLSEETYTGNAPNRGDQAASVSSVTSAELSDTVDPSSGAPGELSSSSSPYQDPADDDDDELAEAIRLSLLDERSGAAPIEHTSPIPIKYAKGVEPPHSTPPGPTAAESSQQQEMDDLEFAIQLSLAENESRDGASGRDHEEFPALSPGPSSFSSGKGKGKARMM